MIKKLFVTLAFVLSLSSLSAFAHEAPSYMAGEGKDKLPLAAAEQEDKKETIALDDIGISIAADDYTSISQEDGFVYVYTMKDDSMPYVIIGSYDIGVDNFVDMFTTYMSGEYEEFDVDSLVEGIDINDITFDIVTYNYPVGEYNVVDRRMFTNLNGRTYMFGSKEVPEIDFVLPEDYLENIAASYMLLAGGDSDYEKHVDSTRSIEGSSTEEKDDVIKQDLTGDSSESIFDYYVDYQNSDGTYTYYFTDAGVQVTLDEDWYKGTFVKVEGAGVTFYQKASYDEYMKRGYPGGRLFSIGACVNSDFQNLPHFEYIGFDEESCMNFFAELPTDVQAYMEDQAIREEYEKLYAGVHDVISGIKIGVGK